MRYAKFRLLWLCSWSTNSVMVVTGWTRAMTFPITGSSSDDSHSAWCSFQWAFSIRLDSISSSRLLMLMGPHGIVTTLPSWACTHHQHCQITVFLTQLLLQATKNIPLFIGPRTSSAQLQSWVIWSCHWAGQSGQFTHSEIRFFVISSFILALVPKCSSNLYISRSPPSWCAPRSYNYFGPDCTSQALHEKFAVLTLWSN